MNQHNTLRFNRPGLFVPSVVRGIIDHGAPTGMMTAKDVEDRHIGTTSSFRYDVPGTGIRSTQQISLDYSKFENHIFFQSARVATNVAFDRIINNYPFDGTRKEIEQFVDSLTGFEKYIFDNIPKNKGFLFFSSSYVQVDDFAGSVYPTISRLQTGESVLNPGLDPMSWEMHLYIPATSNDNQTVCQKVSGSSQGIGLFVSQSASTSTADLYFTAISSSAQLIASAPITKGQFNHIVAAFDRRPGVNRLNLFVNEELIATSSARVEFGEIDFNVSPFLIGSGSTMGSFVPRQTLSGALDEFRFFHDVRDAGTQKKYKNREIFNTDELVLYFRFNEPSESLGSEDVDSVVLDYSGNSLHSVIVGFDSSLRMTGSLQNPMTNENPDYSPVLFPNYGELVDLNTRLLTSASSYDLSNPNLITRMVPPHYLQEAQAVEGLESEDGTIVDPYTGETLPGTGELGQAQIIQSMLFIWAKFFDELKVVLDSFGKSLNLTYDGYDSVPDQLLPKVASYYGFTLPSLFDDATFEQFIDSTNLDVDASRGADSLKNVQNKIWRRLLVNIKDIIRSKGTAHSVKSFIRALGIDPDTTFRIREFGGPTKRNISDQHENRTEVSTMLDMSAGSLVVSPYLSASRAEVGFPHPRGPLVVSDTFHGISSNASDGLLTSGSFTYEGIYKFPLSVKHAEQQSLVRLQTTGSSFAVPGVVANLVATSGSDGVLTLYLKSSLLSSASEPPPLSMSLDVNIFDGSKWNVSFGRHRADDPEDYLEDGSLVKSNVSSSYFLRAARCAFGKIEALHTTQSFYQESNVSNGDAFRVKDPSLNASGTFLALGTQDVDFLSTPSVSDLTGRVSQLRFWSKGLLLDEWKEHVKNFKSVGVRNPGTNFNFETVKSGSFNRLRLDASTDQIELTTDGAGEIRLFDFSQNGFHLEGSGFEPNSAVVKPETFHYSFISPKFDEAATSNKVRARGYQSLEMAEEFGAAHGVVHRIDENESPQDDARFTIDFSIVDALDQDIVNIFSTFKQMENAIGDPALQFAPDYPELENLREIYFNRLTDKINLKAFFEFFKWFDKNIGNFIAALLPRKTKFKGVNFVIESHMLERPKFENLNNDQYLNAATERNAHKGTIGLQQLEGRIKKY